jgi:predicted PurR-regulated permease PerM
MEGGRGPVTEGPAAHPSPEAQEASHRRRLIHDTVRVTFVLLALAALLIMVWFARQFFVWLLAAGFLAFSIDPLSRWMQEKAHVGRGAGIAFSFLAIAAGMLLIVFVVVPPIVDGARELFDAIPGYVQQLQDTGVAQSLGVEDEIEGVGNSVQSIPDFFAIAGDLLGFVGALAGGFFAGFMIFTFTLYFMAYGREIRDGIASRLGPDGGPRFVRVSRDIYESTRGYWYGKFLIGVFAGVSAYLVMKLLGLPFAAPLAFFVGITDLIPNIGATLGAIPMVLVALLDSWWKGLVVIAFVVAYQQIENALVTPRVFAKAVDIHPFVSILVVTVGGILFGIIGTLLAIPVTTAIRTVWTAYGRGTRAALWSAPRGSPP